MEDICKCHCGTRISLDEQLLEERQTWKQKYLCLQRQATNDIGKLKENIYAQCASLMQQEFNLKQNEHTQSLNQKNTQIKSLTSRVVNLEAKVKILEKEKEILRAKEAEMELQLSQKDRLLQALRSRGNKSQRDFEIRLEEQIVAVRKRITEQYQGELQQRETQNEHLKHKVKQFEKKYQMIIPQVQKMKNSLSSKNQQLEMLQAKIDKLKKEKDQQITRSKNQAEQIQKVHSKCRATITKLSDKVDSLTAELESSRKVKKEVKVQPVYIERPVEVQKIVEKIVEVEKIVNKYIEPTTFRDEELETENQKLKEEITHLLQQMHLMEERQMFQKGQYDQIIKQLQENISKYKKQRESLTKTIEQQHKELDMIHVFLEKRKLNEARNPEPQRIIVHVNRDGTYNKTIQRNTANVTKKNIKK